MIISSNKKTFVSIVVLFIVLASIFLLLFINSFNFSKKLMCYMFNTNNFTYLMVDDKVNNYLRKEKNPKIEFNNKTYSLICDYYKKYNEMYIYQTNLDFNLESTNIAYFYVKNLNIFEYLK